MAESSSDRLTNLLGALALGVSDRVRSAAAQAMPSGGETAAALVVIGHVPSLSIDQLSRALRLSHAGAVRLVDRLAALGLVERRPSQTDRRMITLVLTCAGQAQREDLLARRRAALAPLLEGLSEEEQRVLEGIAEKILGSLPHDALSALSTCRFCDERRCAHCPMAVFGSVTTPQAL